MSVSYQIVPSSIRHVRPMSTVMRVGGAVAMQGFDVDPRAGLHRAFVASLYRRTALVDGAPIAMWGVAATLLGDIAVAWLVLAEQTTRMPHAVVREARAELQQLMDNYSSVMTTVLPSDEASVRFAMHLGFRPHDGQHFGDEDCALHDERFRIPVGDSYVVRMGYRPMMVH